VGNSETTIKEVRLSKKNDMKNLSILILVAITSIVFFQCKNDNDNELSENKYLSEEIEKYNSFGINHNNALDFLASSVDPAIADNDEKFSIVSDFFLNTLDSESQRNDFSYAMRVFDNSIIIEGKSFETLLNSSDYSESEKELFYVLENIIQDGNNSNDIWNKIEDLQLSILESKSDYPNFHSLLAACSIGKYSTKYWYDVKNNSNHPFSYKWNKRYCGIISCTILADIGGYASCLENIHSGTWEVADEVCTAAGSYYSSL